MLDHEPPESELTETERLEATIRELRVQVWQARDSAQGATAAMGSYQAKNAELEMLVHQLRAEINRLDQALRQRPRGLTHRIRQVVRVLRRVLN